MNARRGLSLVEIGVAFAVLGFALLPVLNMFSSAGRQARQVSDHGVAVALETKVADEMRTAAWEDVHFEDDLTSGAFPLDESPVTGNTSKLFEAIEDDAKPYGRILAGQDAPIKPDAAALYRLLKTFRTGGKVTAPVAGAELTTVDLAVAWEDSQRAQRRVSIPLCLPHYGRYVDPPSSVEDRARADALIVALLYPGAESLAAAIAGGGGDLETARAVGDVLLLGGAAARDRTDLNRQLSDLAAAAASEPTRARIGTGRTWEAHAASALASIVYLASALDRLAADYRPEKLGNGALTLAGYRAAIAEVANLPLQFVYCVDQAMVAYARAAADPATPRRVQLRATFKFFDLSKLRLLTAGGDLAALRAALEATGRSQAGRNANVERFARWELDHARDVDALRSSYPVPERLERWRTFTDRVAAAVARLTDPNR